MITPPFQITQHVLQLSRDISYELGVLVGAKLYPAPISLRRKNKIKTIHCSLAIEGNALSLEQVTNIMNGKKVIAPEKDIVEVKNAIRVYDKLLSWNSLSIENLKQAHEMLTERLIDSNGRWRERGVGIFKDKKVTHVAPSAKRVPILMENLFKFINDDKDTSWLLKACIFHYELEFIHPFEDGNGRMGRLWQQLLLIKENPIFEFISTESIIKTHQKEYYEVLAKCDQQGDSTQFIEFSLKKILLILKEYTERTSSQVKQRQQRLEHAKPLMTGWFTRKQYVSVHKDISSATASRDLAAGVKNNSLIKKGSNNRVLYEFKLNCTTK